MTPADDFLDSELYVASPRRARFSCEGREHASDGLRLDGALRERLLELELEPEKYGSELFHSVFPAGSALREGLHEALLSARAGARRLRLRLHLAPDVPPEIHALSWELLYDPERKVPLGRSPDTAFSRYSTVPLEAGQAVRERLRMLLVIAAPSDAERYQMAPLDEEAIRGRLEASLEELKSYMDVDFLAAPATPGRLRDQLGRDTYHVLHIVGHGLVRGRGARLVLQNEDGSARLVEESVLADVFLGERELRLVTLLACHGGALSSNDALSGLAGRLVERGLPAVVGMSRAVPVTTAQLFTDHFYRNLARTGRIDSAVNEGRQQLFLAEPKGVAWSSPVLYMRLADARLWPAEEEKKDAGAVPRREEPLSVTIVADQRAPWLRQTVLALVTLLLGLAVVPASTVEADLDLVVSSVAFRLAERQPVVDRFRLRELAASYLEEVHVPGYEPNPVRRSEIGRTLGMWLSAGAAESTIDLQQTIVPDRRIVVVEHVGGTGYRLAIDEDVESPDATGNGLEMSVAVGGKATLKMLHALPVSVGGEVPETIRFLPQTGNVQLEVDFAELVGDEFIRPIRISGLRLFRVEEKTDSEKTFFEEVSTIRKGSAVLTLSGLRHKLREREELRFTREVKGSIYKLEPREDGICLGFRGTVSGLEVQVPGGGRLRPMILGLWLGEGPRRALLTAAIVLLATFLLTTIHPFLKPRR